jgi:hypothetical protein
MEISGPPLGGELLNVRCAIARAPPSPPAEKATAIQYQTRQSGTAQDDQQYQPS